MNVYGLVTIVTDGLPPPRIHRKRCNSHSLDLLLYCDKHSSAQTLSGQTTPKYMTSRHECETGRGAPQIRGVSRPGVIHQTAATNQQNASGLYFVDDHTYCSPRELSPINIKVAIMWRSRHN